MALLESIAAAVANVFGLTRDRSALRNAPAMQSNAKARTDAEIKRRSTEMVADAQTGSPEALQRLRKEASE